MSTLVRDFRFGWRLMARSPGVSAMAVAALALGIGATTAIFSVVNNVLLHPLRIPEPERLVSIVNYNAQRKLPGACAYADVCDWRRQLRSFENIAASQQTSMNLSAGGDPERVMVGKVTASFFPTLGVRPALGRDFLAEEDRAGAGRVAVLSHELWKRRFGADQNVAGATLALEGDPYTVVGVLPESFRFAGDRMDLYVPLAASEARGGRPVAVAAYGRLKRGVTPPQVQAELDAADAALDRVVPQHKGWLLQTRPVSEWIVPDVRLSLLVLMGAVALVVLIACANIANLLLVRAAAREREMAVRAALGAGRWRLIRQSLVESAPVGLAGGALGLLPAWWGVRLLPLLDTARIPRLTETQVDATALGFTAAVVMATCVLFGLAPALSVSKVDLTGRNVRSTTGKSASSTLVVAEVGLAVVLAIGATLMMRTFHELSVVDPGFNPQNLLTASIDLPRAKYASREQVLSFYAQVLESVRSLPGVKSACLTSSVPLGGRYFRGDFLVEGKQYSSPAEYPMLNTRTVDHSYAETMQIAVRKGRFFTEQDREGATLVTVINETTGRRYFGGEDPIGKRIGFPQRWMTIVGVIADIKHTDVAMGPDTEILLPFAQAPMLAMSVAVRADAAMCPDAMLLAPLVRRAVAAVNKDQAVYQVATMERTMADRLAPRRLSMVLLMVFAGLAMALAAVGVYGVLSFSVARRTQEIGVRRALGAADGDVLAMVVRQAMTLALAGVVLGLAAAVGLTRLVASLLYGVSATDPWIFAGAAVLLTAVAALAAYVPARRAVRFDPVSALRYE